MNNGLKNFKWVGEHNLRDQTTTNNLMSMSPESYKEQNVVSKY